MSNSVDIAQNACQYAGLKMYLNQTFSTLRLLNLSSWISVSIIYILLVSHRCIIIFVIVSILKIGQDMHLCVSMLKIKIVLPCLCWLHFTIVRFIFVMWLVNQKLPSLELLKRRYCLYFMIIIIKYRYV